MSCTKSECKWNRNGKDCSRRMTGKGCLEINEVINVVSESFDCNTNIAQSVNNGFGYKKVNPSVVRN